LHESDLSSHGIEGTGMTGVEHYWLRSTRPDAEDEYHNCFYACRFCNTARGTRPTEKGSARLLNPCLTAWADHFSAQEAGALAPRDGDPDASYTAATYDLNDPRRVRVRLDRRQAIAEALRIVQGAPPLVDDLLAAVARAHIVDRPALLAAAEELTVSRARAIDLLRQFALIPPDADSGCRCGAVRKPPDYLEAQAISL
jgi:hypothetical protein